MWCSRSRPNKPMNRANVVNDQDGFELRFPSLVGIATIGTGGLSYLLANSAVSGETISIYDVPLWIVGIALPLTVFFFDRAGRDHIALWSAKKAMYIAAWAISLVGFVVLRCSLLSNSFEDVIYQHFTWAPARYLLLSFLYSLVGYVGAIMLLSLGTWRGIFREPWLQSIMVGLAANSLFFYFSVFVLPRGAIL